MTASQLDLNHWLLEERQNDIEQFSAEKISIGFEEGDDGAWLAMKHRDSGFVLRKFVSSNEEGKTAFGDAHWMMDDYVDTVQRINKAFPATRQVPFYSEADSVQCDDWVIDRLSPTVSTQHWAERSTEELVDDDLKFKGTALGVLNRACTYQEFLSKSIPNKDRVLAIVRAAPLAYTDTDNLCVKRLPSVKNDILNESPDFDSRNPFAQKRIQNKVFFEVTYSEQGAFIEVAAQGLTFDGFSPCHYDIESGAVATIQDDGQIFMANRSAQEKMRWSFTEQELGLQPGQLQMMQFAEVSAFDTLTGKNPFQLSASEDYLGSLDGDVFSSQEQSRDGGMSL